MRKRKLKTSYEGYSDSDTETVLSDGLEHTENNPKLPVSAGLLSDFKAKLATFIKSLRNIATGGAIEVAIKNKDKKAVCKAASFLTQEINRIADGDVEILLSSGFPLTEEPSHHDLPAPTGLSVEYTGKSKEVKVKVNKTKGIPDKGITCAVTLAENAPEDIDDWKHYFSSSHSIVIEGLIPGKIYLFAVAYNGSGSFKFVWCAYVSKMAV